MPSVAFILGRLQRQVIMESNYYQNRHKYSDEELVRAYLKYESQTKAAEELGVSRETVARAVRRKGISLTGRKHNSTSFWKITNAELIEESKFLSCAEIAKKHSMSCERVVRRAKALGLDLKGDHGHWYRRASFYGCKDFDKSITIEKLILKYNGICQICGEPIDKKDIKNGHIRRNYPTLDHIVPLSKGGTHTWDNVQLCHMKCNSKKCDRMNFTEKREEVWT